ncbi:MAG: tetratricopeptide repeat protein, partial [Ignavibacteriae bacterium]|nr:tetratricopeptide repeat protein [Ignavibacteriota bacterium]
MKNKLPLISMMKTILIKMRYILGSLFVLCSYFCYSQQKTIDSLNLELNKHDDPDEYRFEILNSLAYNYYLIDPERGLQISDEAIMLAKKLKLEKELASAYKNKGINYDALSNDSLALLMYDKAIDIQKRIGDTNGVARCIFNKGAIYFGNSDYLGATECYQQAYEIFEKEQDSMLMGKVLNSIGVNLMYRSKYSEAADAFLKALGIYNHLDMSNTLDYASIFFFFLILNKKIEEYDLAIGYQKAALEIYEDIGFMLGIANTYNSLGNIYDSTEKSQEAIFFYEKAYNIMEEINNQEGIASELTNIGIAYTSLKEYDKSLDYLNRAKEMYKNIGNLNSLSIVFSAIGNNYMKKFELIGNRNFLNVAKKNFQLAYDNAKNTDDLQRQILALDELAKAHEMQPNFEQAYKIKIKVEELKKILSLSEKKAEIAKLEAEFDHQRKVAEIKSELANKQEIDRTIFEASLSREKLLKKVAFIGS